MSLDIESYVNSRKVCEKFRAAKQKAPMIPHDIPKIPFHKLGGDILDYGGKSYLALSDYTSKWLEISKLSSKTASSVIQVLKCIFATNGLPKIFVADNMPFNSCEFQKFCEANNIELITSSPKFPQSNGRAEAGVNIANLLWAYRNTPVLGLNVSPAQLLMSRRLREKLPVIHDLLKPKVQTDAYEQVLKYQ
jgi:hypothetical protein